MGNVPLGQLLEVAAGILGGGVLTSVVNSLMGRRQLGANVTKTQAEAESVTINTANALLNGMRQDLQAMRVRMNDMEVRLDHAEFLVDAYRRRVEYLTIVIQRNDITIEDWNPPQ